MQHLQRAAAILFYALGSIIIFLILLLNRGWMDSSALMLLRVLDLPMLFAAILYGGTSLVLSVSKGSPPKILTIIVAVLLGVVFLTAVALNFFFPFADQIA